MDPFAVIVLIFGGAVVALVIRNALTKETRRARRIARNAKRPLNSAWEYPDY